MIEPFRDYPAVRSAAEVIRLVNERCKTPGRGWSDSGLRGIADEFEDEDAAADTRAAEVAKFAADLRTADAAVPRGQIGVRGDYYDHIAEALHAAGWRHESHV